MKFSIIGVLLTFFSAGIFSQPYVGIGNASPARTLDVRGTDNFYSRIHSTSNVGGEAGIEFVRGSLFNPKDWGIINDGGTFKLMSSSDNFMSRSEELRFSPNLNMGIGTNIPTARLHLMGGEDASLATDGYLMIGDKTGYNLTIDAGELFGRHNGTANSFSLYAFGGDIYFQEGGGTLYMAHGSGNIRINSTSQNAKLNINDDGFQMKILNTDDPSNEWFIGASGDDWVAGENQLLFSPANSSSSAVFRLKSVTDNNGVDAPVIIQSSGSQRLLIDGNEFDTQYGPLYINHNSNQNTYLNSNGGGVGIGTSAITGVLNVEPATGEFAFGLRNNTSEWFINPYSASGNLGFLMNGGLVAVVNDESGAWVALSDERYKENIRPAKDVLDRLVNVNPVQYHFAHDPSQQVNIGVLAQEIESVFPEVVDQLDNGQYTVNYSLLSVIAGKALQEQEQQIVQLERELEKLLQE